MVIAIAREVVGSRTVSTRESTGCRAVEAVGRRRNERSVMSRLEGGLGLTGHGYVL